MESEFNSWIIGGVQIFGEQYAGRLIFSQIKAFDRADISNKIVGCQMPKVAKSVEGI